MSDDVKGQQDSILICPKCLLQYPPGTERCLEDDTPLKHLVVDQEETLVGQTIDGRWVVDRKIGSGGMGTVYLANQLNIDRRVAIKTMHRGLERGHEFLERFLREANVASQVSHPNLVSIHDFGQTAEGDLFIVMEYLDGESLGERIPRKRLTLAQALTIASQLCAALAAAHSAGIVHRDLKPDNIFLLHMPGDDIFIKLLDFGIAKHMNSKAMTQTGQVFGTPDYMSPEQCRGKSNIDHRSDLYAIGCILYELISGKPPFSSDSMIQVLFRHVSEPVPQLVATVDDPTLGAVEQIISKLLEKKPGKRYTTALEVREALDAALAQLTNPSLLMPAWRTLEEEEQSKVSTARLGDVTQEELEYMMLAELSEPGTDDLDEDSSAEGLAYIDTQDELPPVQLEQFAGGVRVTTDEAEPVVDDEMSTSPRGKVMIAVMILCLIAGGGLIYHRSNGEAQIAPDSVPALDQGPPLVANALDMPRDDAFEAVDLVSVDSGVQKGPAAELVASAITSAQLLGSIAHRRAVERAERDAKRVVKKTNPPGPRPDRVALSVRSKKRTTTRMKSASAKAERCLSQRFARSPELYEGMVGESFDVEVRFDVSFGGEVSNVTAKQVSGKTVEDPGLFSCVKRPYKKLNFGRRSPVESENSVPGGARLTFKLNVK